MLHQTSGGTWTSPNMACPQTLPSLAVDGSGCARQISLPCYMWRGTIIMHCVTYLSTDSVNTLRAFRWTQAENVWLKLTLSQFINGPCERITKITLSCYTFACLHVHTHVNVCSIRIQLYSGPFNITSFCMSLIWMYSDEYSYMYRHSLNIL